MKVLRRSFELPCTPATFWKAYLDPDFARALYLDALGYRGLEVLEATDTTRKLRVVPKLSLPGPIQKLLGDSFAYEDHGTLDREENVWTWQMVQPSKLPGGAKPKPGVVTTRGVVRIEPIGEQRCRRSDELVIRSPRLRPRRPHRVERRERSPRSLGAGRAHCDRVGPEDGGIALG